MLRLRLDLTIGREKRAQGHDDDELVELDSDLTLADDEDALAPELHIGFRAPYFDDEEADE